MKRTAFLAAMRSKVGAVVLWGAKGPAEFDCSGAVTVSLREAGGPDLSQTHNAAALFAIFPAIARPKPGDLAFWSQWSVGPITHVAVVDEGQTEDVINAMPIISADGASSGVDRAHAIASEGCRVQRHPSIASTGRGYFRGFRSFTELDK